MTITVPAGVTTAEYWDIDGVPLSKYGWNVQTVGGARYSTPALRGANIQYAYVPGQEFRAKIPDSRVIPLAMWVTGVDPDTGASTGDEVLRWNDSWDFLRELLWQPGREFTFTRRWILTDPATGQPSVHTSTGKGQLANPLDLTMTGRTRATFQVDVVMADPFFYGNENVIQLDVGTMKTITNPGSYAAAHKNFSIQLVGPLDRPEIYNASVEPAVRFKLDTTIIAGETVTVDMERFTATSNMLRGTLGYARLSYLIHSGARQFMGLARGDNDLTLYAVGGTGHAVVRFRAPYV